MTNGPIRKKVAIIGAGLAGLTCARRLMQAGMQVQVLEKSRGVGGRMATRRSDSLQFDHGTQYFTVRDPRFRQFIDGLVELGVVQPWDVRVVILRRGGIEMDEEPKERFVGVPTMNSICKHLAEDVEIHRNTRVAGSEQRPDGWHLTDDQGREIGVYDLLLISSPAPQVAELLPAGSALVPRINSAHMLGCWAGLFAFADALPVDFEGAFVVDSPLNWLARDSSKPGRSSQQNTWVVHASAEWSGANIDRDADEVQPELLAAFFEACGVEPRRADFAAAHRWRYALAAGSLAAGALFDADGSVGACGDWCEDPRVEGAYLSGLAMASQVLEVHSPTCSDSDT